MRARTSSLGLVLLLASGCAFLDEVDRRIEQKVSEVDIGKLAIDEPEQPAPEQAAPTPTATPELPVEPVEPPSQSPLGTAPGTPKVAIGPVTIAQGRLSAKQVTQGIERQKNLLRACYAQSDAGDGTVEVTFVVSPEGAVQSAGIERSALNDERLLVCIIQAFKRCTFPAPEGGKLAVLTVPVELSRVVTAETR